MDTIISTITLQRSDGVPNEETAAVVLEELASGRIPFVCNDCVQKRKTANGADYRPILSS